MIAPVLMAPFATATWATHQNIMAWQMATRGTILDPEEFLGRMEFARWAGSKMLEKHLSPDT